ncbi:hypothetical protein HPB51_016098 [Rhipicephalus microplus]|uniref:Secernin-2 n=1 Tax=Rhipicephalus microplus TaxID=6941 RepID=A0A9J6D5R2_RHIMP|nr:hypothetical protein HPB51_016098 [Rhipicephalus microplus]
MTISGELLCFQHYPAKRRNERASPEAPASPDRQDAAARALISHTYFAPRRGGVGLGLERGKTAREALDVIVALLEKYGQGGPCSDTDPSFTYHNSFLIADCTEAWVLETAGKLWAAENIKTGCRNISNCLSIETKIDLCSEGLKEEAKKRGFWDDSRGDLNFRLAFSTGEVDSRYTCGKQLLEKLSANEGIGEEEMMRVLRDKRSGICMSSGSFVSTGSQKKCFVEFCLRNSSHLCQLRQDQVNLLQGDAHSIGLCPFICIAEHFILSHGRDVDEAAPLFGDFDVSSMTTVLRDKDSGICRGTEHKRPTAASQVSVLAPASSKRLSCHWFTGTPDPAHSVFKPFIFCDHVLPSRHIVSPVFEHDPAKTKPRFEFTVDRRHTLYRHHEQALKAMQAGSTTGKELHALMTDLEAKCIREVDSYLDNPRSAQELQELFKDVVESEIKFYK